MFLKDGEQIYFYYLLLSLYRVHIWPLTFISQDSLKVCNLIQTSYFKRICFGIDQDSANGFIWNVTFRNVLHCRLNLFRLPSLIRLLCRWIEENPEDRAKEGKETSLQIDFMSNLQKENKQWSLHGMIQK